MSEPRLHSRWTALPSARSRAGLHLRERPRGVDADAVQVRREAELRAAAVAFVPRLARYIMRVTGQGREFAHDVVQDAMVAAWSNLDRIRDDAHLHPWLYRVAWFKAVDRLRRQGPGGRPMLSLDTSLGSTSGTERRTSRAAQTGLDPTRLREALTRLPESQVGAVRLHYLHGLSLRETADVLGLPRSTVKMRLFRARARLRRILGPSG